MQRAGAVEFETRGSGDPVLCVHGAIIADSFAPLLQEDALSNYRLIRYRRRGYGNSASPAGTPTIAEQVDDARALLALLDAPQAHVVAHSGGGPIAVQLAVDTPDFVRSLVLLEPALQNTQTAAAFHEMIAPLIEIHRAGNSGKAVHLWMRPVSSNWREELEPRIPGVGEQANQDAAGTFEYDLEALRHWDFDAFGPRISQPVLHIVGSRSAAGRKPVTDMFLSAVPHAEPVTIPDADHLLQMVKPDAVAREIAKFLARHSLRGVER